MLFALLFTVAAPVPKTEPADWKAAIKAREFDPAIQPGRATDSVVAARAGGLTATFTLDPNDAFYGTFTFAKKGGPEVKFRGHRFSPVVVRGDSLYFADYCTISSGCSIAAHNLATGKKAWSKALEGIGPVSHSKYRNSVAMGIEQHPAVKGSFALVVTGWEASGSYVEAVDLMTGEQLANKKFDTSGLPKK